MIDCHVYTFARYVRGETQAKPTIRSVAWASLGVVCPKWLVPFPLSLSSRVFVSPCVLVRVASVFAFSSTPTCPRHRHTLPPSLHSSDQPDNGKSLAHPRCRGYAWQSVRLNALFVRPSSEMTRWTVIFDYGDVIEAAEYLPSPALNPSGLGAFMSDKTSESSSVLEAPSEK